MHSFERELSVTIQDLELSLSRFGVIQWTSFLLNPRRLRGSDFLMRWSQGVWSEHRLIQAVNKLPDFFAIPYGPSSTAPTNDVRAFELYFERLDEAGLGHIKRPDILVFNKSDKEYVDKFLNSIGGVEELPFIKEEALQGLIQRSIVAVESENSLWVSKKMPDYGKELRPQKRLGGKLGLRKAAVLPTVIVKEEDRSPLLEWQTKNNKKIHIWHVFFDQAYGLALDRLEELLTQGLIEPTIQTFQAPGGATTKKALYKIYYHYAYLLGQALDAPELLPAVIEDKNGHILPYVTFSGGSLFLDKEAISLLKALGANER
ncbi:MAG: AccI family restriction endonuclease [Candidatus Saccharimonadales bacterium]